MDFKHRMECQLRFTDIDALGHVNNTTYMQLMDMAKVEYFGAVWGSPVIPGKVTPVIANINVNFMAPMFIGDKPVVLTRLEKLGNSSLTLKQQVVNAKDGSVKCEATTVMVNCDIKTGQSVPVADEWREAFSRYEAI